VGGQISTYIKEEIKINVNIKQQVCRITYTLQDYIYWFKSYEFISFPSTAINIGTKKIITKYKKPDLLFVAKD